MAKRRCWFRRPRRAARKSNCATIKVRRCGGTPAATPTTDSAAGVNISRPAEADCEVFGRGEPRFFQIGTRLFACADYLLRSRTIERLKVRASTQHAALPE